MSKYVNGIISCFVVLITILSCQVGAQVKRLSPSEGLSQSYVNTMLIDTESPRVCQRLNNLRNWNYEKIKSLYI
ncbi:hypothetical protein, partial [Pseudoalteromonas sp. TB6-MNA-CIBAN-0076]|uniref:hypothetical protein n=1 Tax=Pseudoalteromonas sp. TB6-MNA-CIBAN-0076 TaxID=3140436 RepID=UPI003331439E